MSKKDKKFSYNNTHGHGIYPPFPNVERYPHTDLYHQNNIKWILEELGILKSWDINLTKLLGMVAQLETDDIINTTNEIQNILDKLNGWIKALTEALTLYFNSECAFNESLLIALNLPNGLIDYCTELIINLTPIFSNLFNCIENRLFIDDKNINNNNNEIININNEITNINNEITNIYNYLESTFSSSGTVLKEGTDYDIKFYNGFRYYNNNFTTVVRVSSTNLNNENFYNVYLHNGAVSGEHAITNDYVYTSDSSRDDSAPIFRHDNGWADTPQSWVYQIKFKNSYSYLNELSHSSQQSTNSGDNIWNMLPTSARASWDVGLAIGLVDCASSDGKYNDGRGILVTMQNISDGINSQYYSYINIGLAETIYFNESLNIGQNIIIY